MEIKHRPHNQSGFALLMSLIVVGVILSIGLSVLELSIKQVRLATNARESETAFHAANAGMECSRYIRRAEADAMEVGDAITPACFTSANTELYANDVTEITSNISGSGEAFVYEYAFTWGGDGPSGDRCTQITTLVASTSLPGTDLIISDMTGLIPGFADGDTKECEAGARCTVISVRGYNRPCATATGYGTVEREVLLQF